MNIRHCKTYPGTNPNKKVLSSARTKQKRVCEIIVNNCELNNIFQYWIANWISIVERYEMGWLSKPHQSRGVNSCLCAWHTMMHDAPRCIIARCINNDVYLGVIYKQMYLDAESFTCRGSFYTDDISANYPHSMLFPSHRYLVWGKPFDLDCIRE